MTTRTEDHGAIVSRALAQRITPQDVIRKNTFQCVCPVCKGERTYVFGKCEGCGAQIIEKRNGK